MKFREMLLLLCCCLCAFTAFSPATAQDIIKDAAIKLVTDIVADPDVQKLKGEGIVITQFQNITEPGNVITRILQEKLTTAFIKAKHFKVVERTQLEQALKELKIEASGLVDQKYQKELGKLVGAGYILLGTISEARQVTSIDCRLISIERGESVTAADVSLAPAGAANSNSAPGQKPVEAPVDLNQKSTPTGNGTVLGKVENGGLLGGGAFKQAWSEPIRGGNLLSFTVGNLRGDGIPRLATVEDYHPEFYPNDVRLCVYAWKNGAFTSVWSSGQLSNNSIYGKAHLRLLPTDGIPLLSLGNGNKSLLWQWNGTSYTAWGSLKSTLLDNVHSTGYQAVGIDYYSAVLFSEKPNIDDNGKATWNLERINNKRRTDDGNDTLTAGDFDGDTKVEIAIIGYFLHTGSIGDVAKPAPIEIYGNTGERKAITKESYSGCLTNWKPAGMTRTYLVTSRNEAILDENNSSMPKSRDGWPKTDCGYIVLNQSGVKISNLNKRYIKPNGGYAIIIQWDGDSYNEVWKSDRQGDEILDLQVGDPKNEGKDGLLILSRDRKGYYLTKVEAD